MKGGASAVRAFVGLGSNLGAPAQYIHDAVKALNALPGTRLIRVSSLYRTAPIGKTDQPDFCNAVAEIETCLSSRELLQHMLVVEQRQGRVRGERNGPRTLDLDLLMYGNEVVRTNDLEIPHPRMHERAFVMVPLAEIAADVVVPGQGCARDLAQRLQRTQRIERWDADAAA